jgi:hypothetical protein
MGVAALRFVLGRQFSDSMTLTGATEDQKPARQRETGSAKKKSHNASDSKHRGLEGARRISSLSGHPERSRGTPWNIARQVTGFLDFARNDRTVRNEIESPLSRITVSRSGPNYQTHRVE